MLRYEDFFNMTFAEFLFDNGVLGSVSRPTFGDVGRVVSSVWET